MSNENPVIHTASSQSLREKLSTTQGAAALIEQLKGGFATRAKWGQVKDIIDALLEGVPVPMYHVNQGMALFRGRIANGQRLLETTSEFSYLPATASSKYGRCHCPDTTVFYGAKNLDTVLSELTPEIGDIVHVGVCQLKEEGAVKTTVIGEIDHLRRFDRLFIGDDQLKDQLKAVVENDGQEKMVRSYLIDAFFAETFSKQASKDRDYKMTSALAEIFFEAKHPDQQRVYEAIFYPSVAHRGGVNAAISPEVFDGQFKWSEFMAFEITDYLGFGIYGRSLYARGRVGEDGETIDWRDVE